MSEHSATTVLARCAVLLCAIAGSAAAQAPAGTSQMGAAAALVGEQVVTIAEVDRAWQQAAPAEYAMAMQRTYDARRKFLDLLIADELIAREAKARGLTTEQLLAEEIPRHTLKMSESDIEATYRGLGDKAKGTSLEQMRPALRAYLERQAPDAARSRYVEELMRTSTRARVLLEPPRMSFERTAQDAAVGPAAAPVEIVAFGDFQNPEYVSGARAFDNLRDTFGDRVRIVFKSLPVQGQAIPINAAVAAQCAKAQGKFWAYHNALLEHPMRLDPASLKRDATTVGLNRGAFDACLDGGALRGVIDAAFDEAARYGIRAAPRYFVNGRLVPDTPAFSVFKQLVEEELMLQARKASPERR